jgi:tRNA (guanine37-N1)-methyltransferase
MNNFYYLIPLKKIYFLVIFSPMSDQSSINLLGLKCPKLLANVVKKILIANDWLYFEAKISTNTISVIFPLVPDLSLESLKPEFFSHLNDFVLEVERYSFETRLLKFKDISQALHSYVPKSYDLIGDILLVKLEDQVFAYKHEIAAVYLSNLPIRSVFHKIEEVHSPHRVASWDNIGGDNDSRSIHKMNGLDFQVDIKKVYFNPRLNNEYLIVTDQINDDDIVWDLFCGVGSFSLTLASKKSVTIHANDINPVAISLLEQNLRQNRKKLLGTIYSYNVDARDIISTLPIPDKVFMNLPEKAKDFLPDVLNKVKLSRNMDITIFLYHFAHKELTDKEDLSKNLELQVFIKNLEKHLSSRNLNHKDLSTRIVRVVSPSKTQFVTKIVILPV